jgi:hypothetical protein
VSDVLIGIVLALVIDERRNKEGQMKKQILVALKNQDRLDQMVPYIEEIAQPGMEVIFLIRFSANGVNGSWDKSLSLEEVEFAGDLQQSKSMNRKISDTYPLEKQRLLAEQKVFLALEALIRRNVKIDVDVYTGSLSRVVNSYTRKGNVHFIMKRAGGTPGILELLRRTFSIYGWFEQPNMSPVLLLRPDHAV